MSNFYTNNMWLKDEYLNLLTLFDHWLIVSIQGLSKNIIGHDSMGYRYKYLNHIGDQYLPELLNDNILNCGLGKPEFKTQVAETSILLRLLLLSTSTKPRLTTISFRLHLFTLPISLYLINRLHYLLPAQQSKQCFIITLV